MENLKKVKKLANVKNSFYSDKNSLIIHYLIQIHEKFILHAILRKYCMLYMKNICTLTSE